MKKKILLGFFFIAILFVAFNFQDIRYGIGQASGQIKVLSGAVPISEIKADKNTPDSILQKIALIEEIRQFAIDSLGLNNSENYTTFYDQKGKPILWVVTASPEFKIKAHQWCFPIAGCFPYKGYFDLEKAKQEEAKMKTLGLDTEIDEVSAWSTLGFFKDPILSSMLNKSEARLADLIIHELTHATIYVKNNVAFNENLANFVGKQGAIYFLKSKYGDSSKYLVEYNNSFKRKKLFSNYIREEIKELNSFYDSISKLKHLTKKRELKAKKIEEIKWGLLKVGYFKDSIKAAKRLKKFNPNNAYFSGFSTYSNKQNQLDSLFKTKYDSNLLKLIAGMKKQHGSE